MPRLRRFSTADQFFDEPQFESYRVLGSHIMDQMCGSEHGVGLTLDQAISKAVGKLLESADGEPQLQTWWKDWSRSSETPSGGCPGLM